MNMWNRLLAGIVVLAWSAAALAAPEPLSVSYKPLFKIPFRAPLGINAQAVESGSISVETTDVFAKPPALRIDCSKSATLFTGINFQVPKARLNEFREKKLILRMKIKRVSGSGDFTASMRCFAKGKFLLGTPGVRYTGKVGEWGEFVARGVIPNNPDIVVVDFQTGVRKTADPAVYIVDECVLEVEGAEAAPAAPGDAPADAPGATPGASADMKPSLVAMIPPADDKPVALAANGVAGATIVLDANPTAIALYAAQELVEHLEKSVGVKLPIVAEGGDVKGLAIHIGGTSFTRALSLSPDILAPDHWVVWRVGDALILSGGDAALPMNPVSGEEQPCGTLFAVYEFLERAAGVRWYWPTDLGTVIPKHPDLAIGNIRWDGAPSYEARSTFYPVHSDRDIPREEVWKWWRRQRWGGIGGRPIANHSFNNWPERFGKEHPEWFALQPNGQRLNEHHLAHMCFSNPEVFKQTVVDVREFFDQNPKIRFKSVMPGDSLAGYYCQCKDCQAASQPEKGQGGIYSNAIWSFVNAVAAEVVKTHPDRYITCASYTNYSMPPEGIQLLPNVAVTLCRGQFPLGVYRPGAKTAYAKSIDLWRDKSANLYIWDYWNSVRYHKGYFGAPSIVPHAIKEWFMMDYGKAKGHAIELCDKNSEGVGVRAFADWMFDATNIYVGMRLLWNMDTDVDKLLAEYYVDLYGPAAPLVRSFHEKMEAAYLNPKTKGTPFQWDWNTCWRETYPAPFVKEVMGLLREAEVLTRGQEPYHARVVKTLNGFLPFEKASQQFHEAAGRDVKNTEVVLPLSAAAPAIDGDLNDAIWTKAVKADGFVDSFNGPAPRAKTQMLLLRDAKTLYIGIRAELPDGRVKQLLPPDSVDRWVWEEDSCEVFFVQNMVLHQFMVGPDNIYADLSNPDMEQKFKLDMVAKWNCKDVRYKSRTGAKEWTAELAVPLASLTIAAPTADAPWSVNFGRSYYFNTGAGKPWQRELTVWRPTFGSFHNVERFGTLYFE